MIKTVQDVMVCPYCELDYVDIYETDEVEFEDSGKGHYYINCRCRLCDSTFKRYIHFTYKVTDSYVYK